MPHRPQRPCPEYRPPDPHSAGQADRMSDAGCSSAPAAASS